MKRKGVILGLTLLFICLSAVNAFAFDFLTFAKNELLVCAHPTANPEKAKIEFEKEPVIDGDVTIAEVAVFYKGWVRDNEMVVRIKYLKTSYANLLNVELIRDSAATGTMSCKYFSGWQEVE